MKAPSSIVSPVRSALLASAISALLSAPWQAGLAAPVSANQAAAAVAGWLGLCPTPLGEALGQSVQRVDTFNDKVGNPLYHVAYLEPAGFVIVAANDWVEPIIGFAAAGKFDPAENNPLGALVSRDLAGRVASAQKTGSAVPDKTAAQSQAKWQRLCPRDGGPAASPKGLITVSDLRVAPLLQSTWSQQTAADAGVAACYNYYTPPYAAGSTANYPAGCVATAMAQLMRYYQFPITGVGSAGFPITYDSIPLTYYLRGGNGAGEPYVWSNMPLVPPANPSSAQCQAIGALVADAGATVNTDYASGGSAAPLLAAKGALMGTFKFANAVQGWNSSGNIGAGLPGMINPNLDARCPVLLGVEGAAGGHGVVADGYGYSLSTLYHHLNLGWSGAANAWYALPLVDTGIYTFTVVDECVYNAYTNGTGEIISGRVLDQRARPVASATVTATRSGGGTYTATTDTNGIYALARIPSSSSYSITVSKANYSSASGNFPTGVSADLAASSGNYWGANFTLHMLPTVLDRLVWSPIGTTQSLSTPFGVTLTALNADNGVIAGFTGPVALSAYATGALSTNTLVGNLGTPESQTDPTYNWTIGYEFTPTTTLQAFSVRSYSGTKVSVWTGTGALVASRNVTSPPGTWTETALNAPVTLSAGTPYRLAAYFPAGTPQYYSYQWPTTFPNGTIGQNSYYVYGEGFPNEVSGTGVGIFLDLRYTVPYSNSVSISPTASGSFAGGIWNGSVTVGAAANNVVLKADDGAGHTAASNPFNVGAAIRLLWPRLVSGGKFQCTVSSAPGLKLEILGSANLSSWIAVTNLTNTTGAILFTDPATHFVRRYYRARQLQ